MYKKDTYKDFNCRNLKEDVAFAESRIRAETIAAEDILFYCRFYLNSSEIIWI
jgi:urease alpha subunit